MDFPEATRVVFDRIQKFEQENVSKIMGYLLLHVTEREMIRLAFIPDNLLQDLVNKSKNAIPRLMSRQPISAHVSTAINPLAVSEIPAQFVPFSFLSTRPLSATAFLTPFWAAGQPFVHNTDFTKSGYFNSIAEVEKPTPFSSLEDQFDEVDSGMSGFSNDCYYPEESFNNLSARMSRRSSSLPEFPVKTCHYFNKGYCKHGSNCRYFHDQNFLESSHFGQNGNDIASDDQVFLPDSLEKLEKEIAELLRSRRGQPVSIASLPMMYYEQYGKVLQADGYLTESQRHGKAGYSLTKLLARLKNSISLIDRPHGQHSVVLAEDASKYLESQGERSDPGPIVSGSRQIYLTFPAESTFTEEDVSDYFNTFGPVDDVRIPCQQKRMFGFVTFSSSDTVKVILAKGNPHFVCGARVLVKPYREKPKLFDRRYYPAYSVDMEPELHSIARRHESSRLLRKQFIEEQEQALELQREHLARLQLAQKSLTSQLCMTCCMDETQVSEEHSDHLLLNNGSSSDDNPRSTSTDCTDQESNQGADLPQSPLASPMKSSISTVV